MHELRIAPRERATDKLATHLLPRHLDVALANGTPPESSAALALRARRLTRLSRRRELARTIRRISQCAPRGRWGVSPLRGRVAAASDELETLAEALAEPNPVSARGVAQALLLVTDGTGPLYNPYSDGSVRSRAATAAANLTIAA